MLLEEFDVKKYERTLRSEGREEGIWFILEIMKESNLPREYAQKKLQEKYSLSESESEQKLTQYWKSKETKHTNAKTGILRANQGAGDYVQNTCGGGR